MQSYFSNMYLEFEGMKKGSFLGIMRGIKKSEEWTYALGMNEVKVFAWHLQGFFFFVLKEGRVILKKKSRH